MEKSAFWEEKDKADKEEMQAKLDKIEADRSEDFIKVTEYEERKQIAEAEREAREAEEKRQRELAEMQRREKLEHDKACTQIQAAWRGYMVRNAGKAKAKKVNSTCNAVSLRVAPMRILTCVGACAVRGRGRRGRAVARYICLHFLHVESASAAYPPHIHSHLPGSRLQSTWHRC